MGMWASELDAAVDEPTLWIDDMGVAHDDIWCHVLRSAASSLVDLPKVFVSDLLDHEAPLCARCCFRPIISRVRVTSA